MSIEPINNFYSAKKIKYDGLAEGLDPLEIIGVSKDMPPKFSVGDQVAVFSASVILVLSEPDQDPVYLVTETDILCKLFSK